MIALCPNPFRDIDLTITLKAKAMLEAEGFTCVVCPIFAEEGSYTVPDGINSARLRDTVNDCELAIVIGGDGTILSAARQIQGVEIPILGVNLGTKGFMTALEPEDLPLIVKAAKGECEISRRMMLDVELYRGGQLVCRDSALNDIVMHGYGDCIKFTAWCDGDRITRFSGDGIILSTPTGSTGYSMSAGGPIAEPGAEAIILSPICAHAMGARSFVLDPRRTVSVEAEKMHGRKAYLSVDGNWTADIENEDMMTVRRSAYHTMMVDMGLKSFYELAYEKLK